MSIRLTRWLATGALLLGSLNAQAGMIYSVTLDTVLNNDGLGLWGGNLNVGQGQELNLTLRLKYALRPVIPPVDCDDDPDCLADPPAPDTAVFYLGGFRVFDNTNGLASDYVRPPKRIGGGVSIKYGDDTDFFSGAGFGVPVGGSINFSGLPGEFGELGDPLPSGPDFDALVEANSIELILRAGAVSGDPGDPGSQWTNNVGGINGVGEIAPGEFSFSSEIPAPATLTLALIGVAGLGWSRSRGAGRSQ